MKLMFFVCLLATVFNLAQARSGPPELRDIFSDTWVATDAIGRTMPTVQEVGPVKTDQRRVVGIFYITWHRDQRAKLKSPYSSDVTKILALDPEARADADHPLWTWKTLHWGEPELGYFLSKDEYVIRKDMSMLADAGVDVLIMDVTNAVHYWDEWEVLFAVMAKMKAEGNKVPQFCFWSFNGPSITVVQHLYDRIYKRQKHKEIWFSWDEKPLLLINNRPSIDANRQGIEHPNPHYDPAASTDENHPHFNDSDYTEAYYQDYTKEVKSFFTLRTMWWGYYEWFGKRFVGTEDAWSFGYDLGDERVRAMAPSDLVSTHQGKREEAAVTPAQHASSMIGKSWTREHGEPPLNEYDLPQPTYVPWLGKTVEHPEAYGIYFQQRWDEAIEADPQFIYINDWNEWVAGKNRLPAGQTKKFLRRDSSHYFVDQYNAEFNRCVQPMKAGYTDNYYMQMAQNIRRYKGIRAIPELSGLLRMEIDGKFDDWSREPHEYRDTRGDTSHRDYPGYGGLHYQNDSGRNDILASKVAVDEDHLYFYAQTDKPLSPHTDNHWMLLLIDADQNRDTGWYGYDYLLNKKVLDSQTTTLMRYDPTDAKNPWVEQSQITLAYSGNALELALPRQLVGLTAESLSFDFHWSDNPVELKDPISLCTHGDSAPNRRFNYRCIWNNIPPQPSEITVTNKDHGGTEGTEEKQRSD